MHVVRAVLRVVVLDQHRWAVQPVVVGLPRIDRARPREAHALDAGLAEPAQLVVGDLAPYVTRVRLDEPERQRPRVGTELPEPHTGGRLQAVRAARTAHDVARRLAGDHETSA